MSQNKSFLFSLIYFSHFHIAMKSWLTESTNLHKFLHCLGLLLLPKVKKVHWKWRTLDSIRFVYETLWYSKAALFCICWHQPNCIYQTVSSELVRLSGPQAWYHHPANLRTNAGTEAQELSHLQLAFGSHSTFKSLYLNPASLCTARD